MPHSPVIDISLVPAPVVYEPPPADLGAAGDCGGEAVFLGRTRAESHPQFGPLRLLRYEAYEEMAVQQLHALAEEAIAEFGAHFVRLRHTVGDVPVGEASVLVQALCGHRAEAFAACRFLIDGLKRSACIWKQEVWERGASWAAGAALAGEHEA